MNTHSRCATCHGDDVEMIYFPQPSISSLWLLTYFPIWLSVSTSDREGHTIQSAFPSMVIPVTYILRCFQCPNLHFQCLVLVMYLIRVDRPTEQCIQQWARIPIFQFSFYPRQTKHSQTTFCIQISLRSYFQFFKVCSQKWYC